MTTTLSAAEIELAKQIGDYWSSTATSNGDAGGTTIVDTRLQSKMNDWVDSDVEVFDQITSGTYDTEERKITSLDNTTGTLTTLAHGGAIASGVTYRIHRLFNASDKRIALINACKTSFPFLHKRITDNSKIVGDWLINGSFETWTLTTTPDNWAVTDLTAAKQSGAPHVKHSLYSAKLNTAAGYLGTTDTLQGQFERLRGKEVTFTVHGKCDTASCLRIGIYDGTTTTYSDYHSGNSAWTEDTEPLEVKATISPTATSINFRVYLDDAGGTAYVDDARLFGPAWNKVYIGDLNLCDNQPYRVSQEHSYWDNTEPFNALHSWTVDADNYLVLPSSYNNRRLRIEGIAPIDFTASGVASTLWTATVPINAPQTEILIANAALYLFRTIAMPNFSSGDQSQYGSAMTFWENEARKRSSKYGMRSTSATVDWGYR